MRLSVGAFDRMGRLVLSGWEDQKNILIENATAVKRMAYGEKRYGVLSQIMVQDRSTGITRTVEDQEWIRRGGMCRRVMSVSGDIASDLRKSGEYQLRLSRGERVCCEVTVTGLFCAFPGQIVKLERNKFGGNGSYRVAEAMTGINDNGRYTELVLRETDLLI